MFDTCLTHWHSDIEKTRFWISIETNNAPTVKQWFDSEQYNFDNWAGLSFNWNSLEHYINIGKITLWFNN